jgi:hypothetical protein
MAGHAGAVVVRAGGQVPGIEVAGDDHHFVGLVGARPVGDDVEAVGVRRVLRRQVRCIFSGPRADRRLISIASSAVTAAAGMRAPSTTPVAPVCGMR